MTLGTLYNSDRLCPFGLRVLIAADELGLSLDVKYGDEIPSEVRAANTTGKWPVFAETGRADLLPDSPAIVERLIELAGARGDAYRCDPRLLAILDEFQTSLGPVIAAGRPDIQKANRAKLESALARMAQALHEHGGPYLAGAGFSQADGHVTPFLQRLAFVGERHAFTPAPLRDEPVLRDWIDRVTTRASFTRIKPTMRALRIFVEKVATYGKAMKIGRLHHSAFRAMWNDLQTRVQRLAGAEREAPGEFDEVRGLCVLLFRAVALHGKFENLALFPTLDEVQNDPAFTGHGVDEHDHEVVAMNDLLALFNDAAARPAGERRGSLERLAEALAAHREAFYEHLAYEETHYLPIVGELDQAAHLRLIREAYAMCIEERPYIVGPVVAYMPIENQLSMIDSLAQAVEPDHPQWRLILGRIHQHLDAGSWQRIVHMFEDIVPTSLKLLPPGHGCPTLAAAAAELEAAFPLARIEIPRRSRA